MRDDAVRQQLELEERNRQLMQSLAATQRSTVQEPDKLSSLIQPNQVLNQGVEKMNGQTVSSTSSMTSSNTVVQSPSIRTLVRPELPKPSAVVSIQKAIP